ncbi:hypothetical protein L288_02320 [Sphingobium quisquiliarum P25]|uniref:Uncharacterized protein n=1 Tax=Sphingobium quisquiliarum P25 TaxID=1329909 RepID=T0HNU9_9SPHN|nr:hypothetical protein L288_02320 [Sphingobium quisquiliarum P25]
MGKITQIIVHELIIRGKMKVAIPDMPMLWIKRRRTGQKANVGQFGFPMPYPSILFDGRIAFLP